MLTELEVRCTHCRGGLVCADQWETWYARVDEVEAAWLAEHGSRDGLDGSPDWLDLVEAKPECETEADCTACGGTGVTLTDTGHEVLAWARGRLPHIAA
ncbi:MAG TPA: hypothetical protein VGR21_09675 [Cryptosporangiaceae bacterium]|nr:hypothetical protein [Cryptosporangiaceae bacterium]